MNTVAVRIFCIFIVLLLAQPGRAYSQDPSANCRLIVSLLKVAPSLHSARETYLRYDPLLTPEERIHLLSIISQTTASTGPIEFGPDVSNRVRRILTWIPTDPINVSSRLASLYEAIVQVAAEGPMDGKDLGVELYELMLVATNVELMDWHLFSPEDQMRIERALKDPAVSRALIAQQLLNPGLAPRTPAVQAHIHWISRQFEYFQHIVNGRQRLRERDIPFLRKAITEAAQRKQADELFVLVTEYIAHITSFEAVDNAPDLRVIQERINFLRLTVSPSITAFKIPTLQQMPHWALTFYRATIDWMINEIKSGGGSQWVRTMGTQKAIDHLLAIRSGIN